MCECSGEDPESWEELSWSPEYRLLMNRQRDKDRDIKKDQNKFATFLYCFLFASYIIKLKNRYGGSCIYLF